MTCGLLFVGETGEIGEYGDGWMGDVTLCIGRGGDVDGLKGVTGDVAPIGENGE